MLLGRLIRRCRRGFFSGGIFTNGGFRVFWSWAVLGFLKYRPAGSGLVEGSEAVGQVRAGWEDGALFLGVPGFLELGCFGLLEAKVSR